MYVSGRSASLWDTVTAQCSLTELSEIKRVIGESLIEQTCELHTEVWCALIKKSAQLITWTITPHFVN